MLSFSLVIRSRMRLSLLSSSLDCIVNFGKGQSVLSVATMKTQVEVQ